MNILVPIYWKADSLGLHIMLKSVLSLVSTPSRFFVATEGDSGIECKVLIDPYCASLETLRNSHRLRDISGAYSCCQTEGRVVCSLDRFLDSIELRIKLVLKI